MSTKDTKTFTPGPWTLCYDGEIDGADGRTVCWFSWDSFKEFNDDETLKANAHLIAAAPELLAALEPFAKFACDEPNDCFNCRARVAVKKAKGEWLYADSKGISQ